MPLGLAASPMKILSDNAWVEALTKVSDDARSMGKAVAVHVHFNHPREITWVTKMAAQKLYERGITVRNQSVVLKGVNDDVDTMKTLIRELADNNITPVRPILCSCRPVYADDTDVIVIFLLVLRLANIFAVVSPVSLMSGLQCIKEIW